MVSKEDFEEAVNKFIADPVNGKVTIFNDKFITDSIRLINEYHTPGMRRDYHHYNKIRTYSVVRENGRDKLVMRKKKETDPNVYVVNFKNYYEFLSTAHAETCHGSRERMRAHLKPKYYIPKWPIEIFNKICLTCNRKKNTTRTGLVVKPILSDRFGQRGQIDLIDLQSIPDGNFKFLLHYQDHLTKFSVLRPLVTKSAAEVASELYGIFCDFGCPEILQSDNGREFVNQIIEKLVEFWPGCRIVHGQPRHPQTQGSIERANADFKNMLRAFLTDNDTTHWGHACRMVQFRKNCTLNRTIQRSPYEAVFGMKPPVMLRVSDEDVDVDDPQPGM